MVGGRVGVIERNTIEVDVVIAVREAAEVGLALTQSNAIAADGEGARNNLNDLSVVGNRRRKVLNISVRDERLSGTFFNKSAAGGRFCRDRIDAGVDRDLLGNGVDAQYQCDLLCFSGTIDNDRF